MDRFAPVFPKDLSVIEEGQFTVFLFLICLISILFLVHESWISEVSTEAGTERYDAVDSDDAAEVSTAPNETYPGYAEEDCNFDPADGPDEPADPAEALTRRNRPSAYAARLSQISPEDWAVSSLDFLSRSLVGFSRDYNDVSSLQTYYR